MGAIGFSSRVMVWMTKRLMGCWDMGGSSVVGSVMTAGGCPVWSVVSGGGFVNRLRVGMDQFVVMVQCGVIDVAVHMTVSWNLT